MGQYLALFCLIRGPSFTVQAISAFNEDVVEVEAELGNTLEVKRKKNGCKYF